MPLPAHVQSVHGAQPHRRRAPERERVLVRGGQAAELGRGVLGGRPNGREVRKRGCGYDSGFLCFSVLGFFKMHIGYFLLLLNIASKSIFVVGIFAKLCIFGSFWFIFHSICYFCPF